ncbi:hypothetical protein BCR41DRAFT_371333 [Lobosporangium transversale]|uniref:Uncharacterized protein n=1 Tax=Lobosporangium transversale TaxID=64571 RepID=A0A1Y2GMT3_9FUNG|nr:hypothetical protein BCR41DRAFT_371333 [Lobosporangium transversale]ORZ13810.1 hypothetical protein BCR41DRAFT_371333 [Lobosporangium transversale]|eukprot:XP_021880594.1 hypothetical protein BCR41DRAFT_371333 [Lobosporangium transversale]
MEIVDDSAVVELSSVELGEDLVKPQHIQDWDDIKNDPGTEGESGDETEEEDWIMRVCSNNDFWQKLQPQMQEAAKAVKTTKAYAGTSRSAIFRKNQRLKTAAMGTPSLTSIGFIGISKEPAESSTNNHNQQQSMLPYDMLILCKAALHFLVVSGTFAFLPCIGRVVGCRGESFILERPVNKDTFINNMVKPGIDGLFGTYHTSLRTGQVVKSSARTATRMKRSYNSIFISRSRSILLYSWRQSLQLISGFRVETFVMTLEYKVSYLPIGIGPFDLIGSRFQVGSPLTAAKFLQSAPDTVKWTLEVVYEA